jgi:hypothetical protein
MNENNILVTGTPRSGTTLVCHLLNKLPNVVALHEPMKPRLFADLSRREEIPDEIAQFCHVQRESIRCRGLALSKNVDGTVPDNPVGNDRSERGLRGSIASKGWISIDKPLTPDHALVLKHNSAFAAVIDLLVDHFPVFGVIRNPLATIGSWNSVSFNVHQGHAPAGERLSPDLVARLKGIDDPLDRQIGLLDWFHGRFLRYLPADRIIRYEAVVQSGGSALAAVLPGAASLREELASRNSNKLYDMEWMLRAGERLLAAEGAFWQTYDRTDVEALLDEAGNRSRVADLSE